MAYVKPQPHSLHLCLSFFLVLVSSNTPRCYQYTRTLTIYNIHANQHLSQSVSRSFLHTCIYTNIYIHTCITTIIPVCVAYICIHNNKHPSLSVSRSPFTLLILVVIYVCIYIYIHIRAHIHIYIYIRVYTFDIYINLSHVGLSHYCLQWHLHSSPTPFLPGPDRICARTIVLHVQICFEFEFVVANVRICCCNSKFVHFLFLPNKNWNRTNSMRRYGVASVSRID